VWEGWEAGFMAFHAFHTVISTAFFRAAMLDKTICSYPVQCTEFATRCSSVFIALRARFMELTPASAICNP
jgi:hypothetical protein